MKIGLFLSALLLASSPAVAQHPAGPTSPQSESTSQPTATPVHRLGIGWAFLYGYLGVPADEFMPHIRQMGGGFGKVYLFWNQIEPERGRYDWTAVDKFVDQLKSPEEGLIAIFSSSMWGAERPSTMLPPAPAKNLDDYYSFIFDTVSHCKGRVRYWQNDCEPNNPIYWSGTKEQFVAQLKVFYKAVKAADPNAVVLCGGYDGLFNPPGMFPMYNQQAGLDFFDYVLQEGRDAFDVFDLRLYAAPYTIPGRVDFIRSKMKTLGYEKPIFSTEYGGPGFFEFPVNLLYIPIVTSWSQQAASGNADAAKGSNQIARLYEQMHTLAPQTQMFLQGCPPKLDDKLQRLQSRQIAIRNILASSAGVERTAYWQLATLNMPRDNLMMLMYGKIGMLTYENHQVTKRFPIADAFARTAHAFDGVNNVKRIALAKLPSIYYFKLDRGTRAPSYVIWERRDPFSGEDAAPTKVKVDWPHGSVNAVDVLGSRVTVEPQENHLELDVSDTPIFLECK